MKKIVSLAAALALVASTAAQAQTASCSNVGSPSPATCSSQTLVKVTVPSIIKLDLSDSVITAATPSDVMFDAGSQTVATLQNVTIKSNALASLTISSAGWNAVGAYTKATADLSWNLDGGGTYNPMTGSAATVVTETTRGQNTHTVGYKIAWSYANDIPGSYVIPVTFTATAP